MERKGLGLGYGLSLGLSSARSRSMPYLSMPCLAM
jgi:hypothetical protein